MWVEFSRDLYAGGASHFNLVGWESKEYREDWLPQYYSVIGYHIAMPPSTRVELVVNGRVRVKTVAGIGQFPVKLPAQCANHGQFYIVVYADVPSIQLELEPNDLSVEFDVGIYEPLVSSINGCTRVQGVNVYFAEWFTFIEGVVDIPKPIKI